MRREGLNSAFFNAELRLGGILVKVNGLHDDGDDSGGMWFDGNYHDV